MFAQRHKLAENLNRTGDTVEPKRQVAANVITKGTILKGDVISPDDIWVDGTVHGEVRGMHVCIGISAVVEGVVVAGHVTVEGSLSGPIFADHIHLGASSRVQGDLCSDNITVSKGAVLMGRVWPNQPPLNTGAGVQQLSQASLPLTAPPLSALKGPDLPATEKSPPDDPAEPKVP